MLEIIFTNFWTWLGTVLLIGTVCSGVSDIIKAVRKPRRRIKTYKFGNGTETVDIENAEPGDVASAIYAMGWVEEKEDKEGEEA